MKSIDKEGVFHRKHEQRDYKVYKVSPKHISL